MDVSAREHCWQLGFSARSMPLLAESLDSLVRMLQGQGAAPQRYLGAANAAQWLKNAGSLQQLCDAGRLDAGLINQTLAEIADPNLPLAAVIDRFLTPHLLLCAARPQLAADAPAWLFTALAAMIAVDAEDALLDVAAAEEKLDGENGCLTLPWLARETLPARWLSRQVTPQRLWKVLSGALPWRDVLHSDLLAEAEAIHRGAPSPSTVASHEEDDIFALMDAFHGLTAARVRLRQLPHTQAIVPAGGGLIWNLHKGQLHTAGAALNLTQAAAAGFLEPPLHALPVPLPLGAGLRTAGWHALMLQLPDADAADELLDSLLDLALDPLPPQEIAGLGFRILPQNSQ
jgi:hypothetical protein